MRVSREGRILSEIEQPISDEFRGGCSLSLALSPDTFIIPRLVLIDAFGERPSSIEKKEMLSRFQ